MSHAALIVMAKAPAPGRSKTRLCPPCTPHEAAALARAALSDTLDAAARFAGGSRRCVLALDGERGDWLVDGFEVVPQRGRGLDERLASAFEDVGGPGLLVGMDTPQLDAALLERAAAALAEPGVDAVLGRAEDGGYWCVGLREPRHDAFVGVPMSSPRTWSAQRTLLRRLGLTVRDLPALRDVDCFDDARAVARAAPHTRFAAALSALGATGADAGAAADASAVAAAA